MQKFHKKCFDHFLNMKMLVHHGQLVQLLGLSTLVCDDKEVLEFNFDGIGSCFTKRNFALVIGLKSNHNIDDKNIGIQDMKMNDIRTKYLKNLTSLDKDRLED